MKRFFILMISLLILLSFSACGDETETTAGGGNNIGGSDGENSTTKSEVAEDETESPYLAPDFTVYDLDGKAVKLSDFRGKPIVVNIWASTCGPCKSEMPDFQKAYEKYGGEVQFLMVDYIGFYGESVKSGQGYVDGQGYTFPVYFDTDHDAARTYGINSIPFTMFINEDFELYTYLRGMTNFETIEKYIKLIK